MLCTHPINLHLLLQHLGPHDQDKKTSQRTQYNRNRQNYNNYLGSILARPLAEETSDQEVQFCWTSGKGRQKVSFASTIKSFKFQLPAVTDEGSSPFSLCFTNGWAFILLQINTLNKLRSQKKTTHPTFLAEQIGWIIGSCFCSGPNHVLLKTR